MTVLCPVVNHQINEKLTRLNALFTVLVVGMFFLTGNSMLLLFLFFDFLMRAYFRSRLSLLAYSSKFILQQINTKPVLINAGPKIFAARIGLIMTVVMFTMLVANFIVVTYFIGGVLMFFAFLEAALGYCVACKLYPFVFSLTNKQ